MKLSDYNDSTINQIVECAVKLVALIKKEKPVSVCTVTDRASKVTTDIGLYLLVDYLECKRMSALSCTKECSEKLIELKNLLKNL